MVDRPANNEPGWLAALADPILGDLHLTLKIVAAKHIPDVLRAFGEQDPPTRRRIVIAVDDMALKLWLARKHKRPKKFADADADLERLENVVSKLLVRWSKATPYYQALLQAMVLMVPPNERRNHKFEFDDINVGPKLEKLLPVVRALRSPDMYGRAFSQPSSSRKSLERAILWERLFDLMADLGIENFSEHQPLIDTIRALHLACKISPPDPVAVRQAASAWKRQRRR